MEVELMLAGFTALGGLMFWNLKISREHCIDLARIKENLKI